MSNPLFSSYLPDLRRIVTAHDERGLAIVESDSVLPSQVTFSCQTNELYPYTLSQGHGYREGCKIRSNLGDHRLDTN